MTRAKSGRRRRRPCSYSHRSPSDSRRGTRERIHLPLPTSHSATRPSLRVPPDPPGIATASVADPQAVLEVDPAVQDGEIHIKPLESVGQVPHTRNFKHHLVIFGQDNKQFLQLEGVSQVSSFERRHFSNKKQDPENPKIE